MRPTKDWVPGQRGGKCYHRALVRVNETV
jgi:hypothetical protein